MEIVNLDSMVPDSTKVIVGGMELIIPGNSSLEYSLRSIKYSQILSANPMDSEVMELAFENFWNEIESSNPHIDKATFRKKVSVLQYTQLVSMLYGNKIQVDEKKTSIGELSAAQSRLEK
jgi:hypothetical protein